MSKKKKSTKSDASLAFAGSPELQVIELLPKNIKISWLNQMYDSKLFEEGDAKGIHDCLQYWGIFVGRLFKDETLNNRQEFIEKSCKLARKHYPLYEHHRWLGLAMDTPVVKVSEEEEGEEEDHEEWFDFINTDYYLILMFMLDFITSSEFQFELFKTIFRSPKIIKSVEHELPYTIFWPKISYVQQSSFKKLDHVIGPAFDFTSIENTPDVILPLSMSSDVNDDFWMEFIEKSFNLSSELSLPEKSPAE